MTIIKSKIPDITYPDSPLTTYIFEELMDQLDSVAIVDGPTGRSYTYGQLLDAIQRFAGALTERKMESGEVLAIVSPNLPEYAIAMHGTLYAGGTVTTINPTYTAKEIIKQLENSGATRLVSISLFEPVIKEIQEQCTLKEIVLIDGDGTDSLGAVPLSEYLAAEPLKEHAPVDVNSHIAVLPYSSGTTGLPKGVMLSHSNLTININQAEAMVQMENTDVCLAVLPFFHIYGMHIILNCTLKTGGKVVTQPRFDLEEFLGLIQEHKATRLFLVPPIILALARHPIVDNYDTSSIELITSGAAPLSGELAAEASERLGTEIVQGYGMTELSPLSHASLRGSTKTSSVGYLTPNTECRIVSVETGEDMEPGEDGELYIRGPQVMMGYLNNSEATAETIDSEGWLHTGDVGHIDEDGDFYIVDRSKELIKYKGFQVSPAELEGLLLTHPAVADAGVIGIPDEEAGEIPKAFVTLKEKGSVSEQDIKDFVADEVATFKQLREVEFVDEIPKSPTGKILRRILRDG